MRKQYKPDARQTRFLDKSRAIGLKSRTNPMWASIKTWILGPTVGLPRWQAAKIRQEAMSRAEAKRARKRAINMTRLNPIGGVMVKNPLIPGNGETQEAEKRL